MPERLTRDDRAQLIRAVQEIRERTEELLEILLPEDPDGPCRHPADRVTDESSMGEELYRCGACGAESDSLPIPIQE